MSKSVAAVARAETADAHNNVETVITPEMEKMDRDALEIGSSEITAVQVDGQSLMRIVKHCRDSHSNYGASAWGAILGAEVRGTLEVSNVFGLPGSRERADEEERGTKNTMQYIGEMLRLLRQVNIEISPAGLYQGCFLGPFLNSAVVDSLNTLSIMVERENENGTAVLIVLDYGQLAQGNTLARAFRLSPSFIDAYRKGKITTQNLVEHRLTINDILVELPLRVVNSSMLNALLTTLSTESVPEPTLVRPTSKERLMAPASAHITPNYMDLNLALEPVLMSSIETTFDTLENYASEAGNVGYQTRQIAREKSRADAYVARRRAENETRVSAGLQPLEIEDVSKHFKIPAEPNRLESMLLLHQLNSASERLGKTAAVGAVQLEGAHTGSGST